MACPYCLSNMIYLDTDNLLHCQYCGDSFTQAENWVDDCPDDFDEEKMHSNTLRVKKINLKLTKNQQVCKRVLAFGHLAFHRATTDNTVWVITHIQTGKAICKSRNKQAIKRFVKAFGDESFWCNWNNNENDIRRALRLFGLKLSVKSSV